MNRFHLAIVIPIHIFAAVMAWLLVRQGEEEKHFGKVILWAFGLTINLWLLVLRTIDLLQIELAE